MHGSGGVFTSERAWVLVFVSTLKALDAVGVVHLCVGLYSARGVKKGASHQRCRGREDFKQQRRWKEVV